MSFRNIFDDRYDSRYDRDSRHTLRKTFDFIKRSLMALVEAEERKLYNYSAYDTRINPRNYYPDNSRIEQTKQAISVVDEVFSRYDYMDNQIKMMYTERSNVRRAIDQIADASNNIVLVYWTQDIQDWLNTNYPNKHTVVKLDGSPAIFIFEDVTAAALFKTFWG